MFSLSSTLALLACVGAVSAAPTVALTFGWNDVAPIIVITVLTVVLWTFAPFAGFGSAGNLSALTSDKMEQINNQLKTKMCGLYSVAPWWVALIVTLLGQAAFAVVFIGYILHEFIDDVGAVVPLTETWYMIIVILAASAIRLHMIANEFYYRMSWFPAAVGASALAVLSWIATVVFLILEIVQLPATITIPWEIALLVVSGVWILVELFSFGRFVAVATIDTSDGFYKKL